MNVNQLKRHVTDMLAGTVGGEEAAAMSREIIRHLLGLEPAQAVLAGDRPVETLTEQAAERIVKRVNDGEPLQYVLGSAYFMGMEFKVTPAVLIPRPETSQLVDIITDDMRGRQNLRVLDVGTGSGCIAISLCRALPFAEVSGMDISAEALAVARENGAAMKTPVRWLQADILTLSPQPGSYDVIVSNPPYIAESEKTSMDPRVYDHEPHTALFVPDSDPLRFYRAITHFAATALAGDGVLYFEINPLFVDGLRHILSGAGFGNVDIIRDFRGNYRFAVCRR